MPFFPPINATLSMIVKIVNQKLFYILLGYSKRLSIQAVARIRLKMVTQYLQSYGHNSEESIAKVAFGQIRFLTGKCRLGFFVD